ncbi:TLP18.3/Psb32/MOLO-1 phosphatase superfamily protein [Pasteurella langaaensis DSM 22999]|uniref:TLP18.3/Psb32/MOLO-1 phosphatase superfamily protein n=1 Tax=Alitibacter langaaensis DSM 22999 TaxID=1122935 RepID=A0A2U0T8D8_9PAST|nr:TPM domain-containing protein [Pasteurella langaaensis]PVX39872.1 TLP18.3/Psb32/MOLO-1 phosphatase superfamily protein [Pasteurella langaaensis DSM 22999]
MPLFSAKIPFEKSHIEQAIVALEQQTSAELRVYIEPHLQNAPILNRTLQVFDELGMQQTQARNAVLIYIAYKDHQSAIIGDEGIHQFVGDDFWQQAHQVMVAQFKQGKHTDAVVLAIQMIGKELAKYFPIQPDDVNELPNEVIING